MQTPAKQNIFDNVPPELPEEWFDVVLATNNLRIERIVSENHVSPPGYWYDQNFAEWVILMEGEAELEFQNPPGTVPLAKGDFLNIPAHCRHRITATSKDPRAVWLAIRYEDNSPE